jgi:hypothetical protein
LNGEHKKKKEEMKIKKKKNVGKEKRMRDAQRGHFIPEWVEKDGTTKVRTE